jgi:hypothetical protein
LKLTQREEIAAQRGWWAGRLDLEPALSNEFYLSLPFFSPEALLFNYWFNKGRAKQLEQLENDEIFPPEHYYREGDHAKLEIGETQER